jgi:hypothetical protein
MHYKNSGFLFHFFFGILMLLIVLPAKAQRDQKAAAIDSTQVRYFNRSFDSLFLGVTHHIDTAIGTFTQFDALSKGNDIFLTLSNAGAPHKKIVFSPVYFGTFDVNQHTFTQYLKSSKDVRYLDPVMPFTELNYLMGSKKEQHLNASFNRQVSPRLFIGMEYFLVSSPGIYKNNKIENSSVYFTSRYSTKNQKYGVLAHYFHNKLTMGENGGIANDGDFETSNEFDRRIIAVNLIDAQNRVKQSGFGLEHYYVLSIPQVVVEDTIETTRNIILGRITHQMEYQRNQMIYSERSPLEAFYRPYDVVLDSTLTFDSIYVSTFRNRLQWSNLGYKLLKNDMPLYIYGGVETLNASQSDSLWKKDDWQLNPYGGVQISLLRSFFIDGQVKLITGSYATGDLLFEGGVKQFLGTESRNLGNVFFRIKLLNQSPSWFHQRFESNHFRWENSFVASKYLSFTGGYKISGLTVGGNLHILDKHIYMSQEARPTQTSGTFRVVHLFSDFHFKPGKFDLIGSLNYQRSDNDTIVHLPELSAKMRVTFTSEIFKGAATIQTGFDASWFSKYFADAYMPALRSFYLQDEKAIGGYPFVDLHLALKVKRARIFAQYANIFGLTGNFTYYTTPHYPMRDPRFYLGVSWRFYK